MLTWPQDHSLKRPPFAWPRILTVSPTLQPGDRIGSFEVEGVLGSGGMGEVYRARDATLQRDVAIKVLPRALAADPQRVARFERESRVLASLNHPNIAAIHSVAQVGDLRLFILELVEGPTLADRLQSGPLPPIEALDVARELASALAVAHERGVVHRDVKPANVKLTSSSGIKLLDFGLAKERALPDVARHAAAGDATVNGMILGTCAYMSPEQARGKATDSRTDIWAFGCVLFEMLSGARAFDGDTTSDAIAAVLEHEPDWSRLPAGTPPGIRRVLRRCLEKDPNQRLHAVADARLEIEDALANREQAPARTSHRTRAMALAILVTLGAGGLAYQWWRQGAVPRGPSTNRTTRFTWALPDGLGLDSPPTVSPDGQVIAFTARARSGGPARLYVRSLDQLEAHPLPGTEGAKQPFWSPDASTLGYFSRGKLMKVALDQGAPVELGDAPDGRGGTWSPNGVIVFSPLLLESGLMQVSEHGGKAVPATLVDVQQGETAHRWPAFLPDGQHFLYFVRALSEERRGVYLGRIGGPASLPGRPLFRSDSEAVYAPLDGGDGGALLSVANGRIEARPFDARRRLLTGDPRRLDLPTGENTPYHAIMLSVSADVLAHAAASVPYGVRLATSGRGGEGVIFGEERATQGSPRLSPEGTRLARVRLDAQRGNTDVWIDDLARGTRLRLPTLRTALLPVWSPDGHWLAHVAGSIQNGVLTISAADGTGAASTVACPERRCDPTDWSPDGRWLLATVHGKSGPDVWMLSADAQRTARPLLVQPFPERDARFSPDGRLVAYVSEETGRPEVSVRAIDTAPRREVLSVAGGDQPVWRRDGRELFFVDPQGLLRSTAISTGSDDRLIFGKAALLDVPPIGSGHGSFQYDVSPDGQRIHFLDRRPEPPPSEFGVIVGWRRMLK